jgi:hypothetical protein
LCRSSTVGHLLITSRPRRAQDRLPETCQPPAARAETLISTDPYRSIRGSC